MCTCSVSLTVHEDRTNYHNYDYYYVVVVHCYFSLYPCLVGFLKKPELDVQSIQKCCKFPPVPRGFRCEIVGCFLPKTSASSSLKVKISCRHKAYFCSADHVILFQRQSNTGFFLFPSGCMDFTSSRNGNKKRLVWNVKIVSSD